MEKENSSIGVYYGVAMKTSPWYVHSTFQYREDAEKCISSKKHPEDWMIVEY